MSDKNGKNRFFDKDFFKFLLIGVLSGIIAGLITGYIVGQYLYDYQKANEEKQNQRRVEREISVGLESLKYKIAKVETFNISSVKQPSDRLSTFAESIKIFPLGYWIESSSKYNNILSLIISFQNKYLNFINICNEFDAKLTYLIRVFNSKKNLIEPNDIFIYKYFVGKLNKLSDTEIMPFFDYGGGISSTVKEGYAEISRSAEIKKIKKEYISEEKDLNTILDTIKIKIN